MKGTSQMHHEIFVPSYKPSLLDTFCRSYNLRRKETDQCLTLVIDDRFKSVDEFQPVLFKYDVFDRIVKVTDIVKYGSEIFGGTEYYENIMKIYPIAFKLLVFLYFHDKYSVKKGMMLDDDTLFIEPVDEYFEHENAIRSDSMKADYRMLSVLSDTYLNIDVSELNKNLVNSGSIILSWNEDLVEHMRKFFDSYAVCDYLAIAHQRSIKAGKPRIAGMAAVIEQMVYGCYLLNVKEKTSLNPAVSLITSTANVNKELKFNKYSNIYHFLMRDKLPQIEWYLKALERDYIYDEKSDFGF